MQRKEQSACRRQEETSGSRVRSRHSSVSDNAKRRDNMPARSPLLVGFNLRGRVNREGLGQRGGFGFTLDSHVGGQGFFQIIIERTLEIGDPAIEKRAFASEVASMLENLIPLVRCLPGEE